MQIIDIHRNFINIFINQISWKFNIIEFLWSNSKINIYSNIYIYLYMTQPFPGWICEIPNTSNNICPNIFLTVSFRVSRWKHIFIQYVNIILYSRMKFTIRIIYAVPTKSLKEFFLMQL